MLEVKSSRDSPCNENFLKVPAEGYRDTLGPRNEEEDEKMLRAAIDHSQQEYQSERAIGLDEDDLKQKFLQGMGT